MSNETPDKIDELTILKRENEALRKALQKIREAKKLHEARGIAYHALEKATKSQMNQEI
jgi:hypothetical protein